MCSSIELFDPRPVCRMHHAQKDLGRPSVVRIRVPSPMWSWTNQLNGTQERSPRRDIMLDTVGRDCSSISTHKTYEYSYSPLNYSDRLPQESLGRHWHTPFSLSVESEYCMDARAELAPGDVSQVRPSKSSMASAPASSRSRGRDTRMTAASSCNAVGMWLSWLLRKRSSIPSKTRVGRFFDELLWSWIFCLPCLRF